MRTRQNRLTTLFVLFIPAADGYAQATPNEIVECLHSPSLKAIGPQLLPSSPLASGASNRVSSRERYTAWADGLNAPSRPAVALVPQSRAGHHRRSTPRTTQAT